jgi:hypothetical protein
LRRTSDGPPDPAERGHGSRLDVIDAALLGEVRVAVLDGAPDRRHFAQAFVASPWLRHRRHSQQRDPVVQRPEHSFDKGILAAADERCVKFRLGFERRHQIARGERGPQFGDCIPDSTNHGGVVQTSALTSGESFENSASRVELSCFLQADGADDGTAMGNRADQAICLQQPERLAN